MSAPRPYSNHPDRRFMYDEIGGDLEHPFHDAQCKCPEHCGNCYTDLPHSDAPKRARYCSDYCRGRAARERALDRHLLHVLTVLGAGREP